MPADAASCRQGRAMEFSTSSVRHQPNHSLFPPDEAISAVNAHPASGESIIRTGISLDSYTSNGIKKNCHSCFSGTNIKKLRESYKFFQQFFRIFCDCLNEFLSFLLFASTVHYLDEQDFRSRHLEHLHLQPVDHIDFSCLGHLLEVFKH